MAGRRFYPVELEVHPVNFAAALIVTSLMIFSIGFVIASIVPTARFAQPIGTVILYPLLSLSGIFVEIERFPAGLRTVAEILPFSHAVSLLRGAWAGANWFGHLENLAVLAAYFVGFSLLSSKVFRWE